MRTSLSKTLYLAVNYYENYNPYIHTVHYTVHHTDNTHTHTVHHTDHTHTKHHTDHIRTLYTTHTHAHT